MTMLPCMSKVLLEEEEVWEEKSSCVRARVVDLPAFRGHSWAFKNSSDRGSFATDE